MISFLQLADGAPANRYGKPVGRPARSGMRAKPGPDTISIDRGILARRLDAELAERDGLCLEAARAIEARTRAGARG